MALIELVQAKKYLIDKYTHILIDESQDLTRAQLEFLKASILKAVLMLLLFKINKTIFKLDGSVNQFVK